MKDELDVKSLYKYKKDGNFISIGILLDFYKEIYNDWDFSPPNQRDLDEDLIEYLMECLEEIPLEYNVEVALSLPEKVRNSVKEERAILGYRNFFRYKIKRLRREMRKQYRKILTFMLVGAVLFSVSLPLEKFLPEGFPYPLLPEILWVGTWVAMWEAFEIFLFTIPDMRKTNRNFHRLLNSKIIYTYRPSSDPASGQPDSYSTNK